MPENLSLTTISLTEAARRLRWSREYLYRVLHRLADDERLVDYDLSCLPDFPFRRQLPIGLVDWLKINHRKGKPGRKPKTSGTEMLSDD